MLYVIVAIIAVVLLIPLVYELPNYVYNRKQAVLGFLCWHTPIYISLFLVLLAILIGDGFLMIQLTSVISLKSSRLWIGIVIGFVGLLYFPRLIPIYYDDKFDIRSDKKLLGVLIRELVAIAVFVTALYLVSFYVWSYIIDGVIGAVLIAWRIRRYVRHRKKNKIERENVEKSEAEEHGGSLGEDKNDI